GMPEGIAGRARLFTLGADTPPAQAGRCLRAYARWAGVAALLRGGGETGRWRPAPAHSDPTPPWSSWWRGRSRPDVPAHRSPQPPPPQRRARGEVEWGGRAPSPSPYERTDAIHVRLAARRCSLPAGLAPAATGRPVPWGHGRICLLVGHAAPANVHRDLAPARLPRRCGARPGPGSRSAPGAPPEGGAGRAVADTAWRWSAPCAGSAVASAAHRAATLRLPPCAGRWHAGPGWSTSA